MNSDSHYGWKCPQCSTIYAPTQEKCMKCAPFVASAGPQEWTFYYGAGTIQQWGSGTVFFSPPKTEPIRARETVDKWVQGGNSAKSLIDAAVQVLIDRAVACEDADEEERDDE